MKLITPRIRAKEAASNWKEQYFVGGKWQHIEFGSSKSIYESLLALGENPRPREVARIIGNESWTRTKCDECESFSSVIVRLGQEPDYESATAYICDNCLSLAIALATPEVVA